MSQVIVFQGDDGKDMKCASCCSNRIVITRLFLKSLFKWKSIYKAECFTCGDYIGELELVK